MWRALIVAAALALPPPTTTRALPPHGWVEYCARVGCPVNPPVVELPQLNYVQLREVNQRINAYPAVTDLKQYGVSEYWQDVTLTGRGDCEDFVLAKRRLLLEAGYPPGALRFGFVRVTTVNDGHLVLLVDTLAGTWVLDSFAATVPYRVEDAPADYAWLATQDANGVTWSAPS